MTVIGNVLISIIQVYTLVLIIRVIVEMIQSFSRNFSPPSWFMRVAEVLFVITDPPVKAIRRVIPPLRLGAVMLDVSIIVLFVLLQLLQKVIAIAMF